jgi:hypothetical protein
MNAFADDNLTAGTTISAVEPTHGAGLLLATYFRMHNPTMPVAPLQLTSPL